MSNAEDIARLKNEVRELRKQLERLEDNTKQAPVPFIRLARKEGAESGGFQPFIFMDPSLSDRQASSIHQSQPVTDLIVFENRGEWFHLDCAGQPPSAARECLCSLIDLLRTNNNLSDITTQEWDDLETGCECDTFGGTDVECNNCLNEVGPGQFAVTISGVTTGGGTLVSVADQQAVRDWFNAAHNLDFQGGCVWNKTALLGAGNNIEAVITVNPSYSTINDDGAITLSMSANVVSQPGSNKSIKNTVDPGKINCKIAHLLDEQEVILPPDPLYGVVTFPSQNENISPV